MKDEERFIKQKEITWDKPFNEWNRTALKKALNEFAGQYHTKQLILFGVIESNGVNENEPRVLGLLTEEQINRGVNHCTLCKYKKFGNGGKDCTECVNNGQPHQYFL